MLRNLFHKTFSALGLASLLALLPASFALAGLAEPAGPNAPNPPAKVVFQTSGLPAGISLTITGFHTNPGDHTPLAYSTTFASPGPSVTLNSEPNTEFSYSGFPAAISIGSDVYSLIGATPGSPFFVGGSGSNTSVVASYTTGCVAITITIQPTDVTVELGSPATFLVAVTGTQPTYQWRRNGTNITGATSSSYTIPSVGWSDNHDSYDVVITNDCSTVTSNTAILTVTKMSQTISFPQPANPQSYQATFEVNATASSGLPVSFSVNGGCSLTGTTVTMTSGTNTCAVTALQEGDNDYQAAPDVIRTVDAAKLDQSITFATPASPAVYDTQFSVSPTTSSGLAVTLAASGACLNSGFNVLMISGIGTCTLTASQNGDDNYNAAADVTRTVEAIKANQTITFPQSPSLVKVGSVFDINPTSSSGLTVIVTAEGACSIADNTVTASNLPGTCTLTASQAGNEFYFAAENVVQEVEVTVTLGMIYLPIINR